MAGPLAEVEAGRWDALLGRLAISDAYYARGYVEASATLADGTPAFLHLAGESGDVVFPCLVRADPPDVVTPYGYGGPLPVGPDPPLAGFAAAYEAWCAACGVVSTFAVFHPLFANHADADPLGLRPAPLAGTVGWRLAGDLEAGMHPHHRRLVRRARRTGLIATAESLWPVPASEPAAPGAVAPVPASEPAAPALDTFVALYEDAMRRMGAASFYVFPPAYWTALARAVPLVPVEVRDADGALVAAVLGMGEPPWLHYHLGAASAAGRGSGASHLALLTLAAWGAARGYELLHLGGGVGGRADSLLDYKRRFAPDGLLPAALGKAVHDRAAYARLTGSEAIDWNGFFPAYRTPS